jgi:hypothetical protein
MITLFKRNRPMSEAKTVSSRLIYQAYSPHDESRPEFDCYNPVYTGLWWVVDCWVCNSKGEIHPGHNVAAVPVGVSGLGDPVGAMSVGPLWEED